MSFIDSEKDFLRREWRESPLKLIFKLCGAFIGLWIGYVALYLIASFIWGLVK